MSRGAMSKGFCCCGRRLVDGKCAPCCAKLADDLARRQALPVGRMSSTHEDTIRLGEADHTINELHRLFRWQFRRYLNQRIQTGWRRPSTIDWKESGDSFDLVVRAYEDAM